MARHASPYDPATDAPASADTAPVAAKPRKRGTLKFLRDAALVLGVSILAAILIKTFLIQSFFIPSASMENTLQINDHIMVNQMTPEALPLHRGDIVVFKDPGGWLPSDLASLHSADPVYNLIAFVTGGSDTNNHIIKRVIGLPGDHIECCSVNGKLKINGEEITEPYVMLPDGVVAVSETNFSVTVPAGSLWVMGDNRYNSADSRYNMEGPTHGFVPLSSVTGNAFAITWPLSSAKWLNSYPDVFANVPEGVTPVASVGDFVSTPLSTPAAQ